MAIMMTSSFYPTVKYIIKLHRRQCIFSRKPSSMAGHKKTTRALFMGALVVNSWVALTCPWASSLGFS